ncbi:uncharacterized protein LOC126742834 [Anthonomus grandis grandis]|uniref:uncharacterized protein LOC126742834 n=1 Tax=Anthonomus grandis grandis TaxID=2921223 RepID=UPI002166140F|nr:uncharacterized protein LOC126742834 [Anthonomus grandis grandis]
MTVSLPKEKRKKIINSVKQFRGREKCKIREFAKFIGILTSACPAVKYGWLYTKAFEREKFLALQSCNGNYNSRMSIPSNLSNDFDWWLTNIPFAFNSLGPMNYKIEIFSDASPSGWGVCCNGEKSHGFWSPTEKTHHINYLELLSSFFGLKCFASHLSNVNILCRIDNTTAIAFINRMGSIQFPKLNILTKEIWQWCERRNIYIFASYIKSKDNTIADQESRSLDIATEYELNQDKFQVITSSFGQPQIDLFASRTNAKCKKFVSWGEDPESWAVDAFTLDGGQFYFYAFPPFSVILRVLQKIIDDKAEGVVVVPNWNSQPWYPGFRSLLAQDPNSTPALEKSFPGGRSLIVQALQNGKVPDMSLEICTASISNSTNKQYNVGLKLWWQFCCDKNIDVFDITVPLVLEFLTIRFNKGASYSSLNCYRSAISQIASPDLANDYRLKRFFKGVYGLRPSLPKYNVTWDPSTVLTYVKTLSNENIKLDILTQKVAILLALTTGQRVQTLASIQLENLVISKDNITIKIPKRIKTSGPNRFQPTLVLPIFKQDLEICVYTAILCYLKRTKNLRNTSCKSLFILPKKPHKDASSQSISRWIKCMLSKSGVDISMFTAHSTRHAATFAAARKGVSLDTIRLSAGWTEKSSTFANFYQRPLLSKNTFANDVLSC